MQNHTIEQELQQLLASMNGENEGEEVEAQTPGQDETKIQDVYVLVVRESADPDDPPERVVETTLTPTKTDASEPIDPLLYATGLFLLILVFSSLFSRCIWFLTHL